MSAQANTFAVEFCSVCKSFGSVRASDQLSFQVRKGSIHGIVGENGAGKSTAMKLLYGLYHADSGEIRVNGKTAQFRSPLDAIAWHIGMVHQHFMLSHPHTVLENIILGVEPRNRFGLIDREAARKDIRELAKRYGLEVDLDAQVASLPVGVQQRIEILKALYRRAEILILDEPTAVLTPPEVDFLFENLRRLKDEGKTILLITHKLREVMKYTDRITVFRAGRVSGELDTAHTSASEIASMMVGRSIESKFERKTLEASKPVLEVNQWTLSLDGSKKLDHLNFTVHAGEIVGIAGVEGNGQNELVQSLLQLFWRQSVSSSGKIRFEGKEIQSLRTREILDLAISCIPQDRHREAVLLSQDCYENFMLGQIDAFTKNGFIESSHLHKVVADRMEKNDVRPRAPELHLRHFSGGNQQKLVIARELEKKPKFLIAGQPTRGVDIGAIEKIHEKLIASRNEGMAILLVSSELDEVLALSDRILVFYEGRIVGEFTRETANERVLGEYMGGAK